MTRVDYKVDQIKQNWLNDKLAENSASLITRVYFTVKDRDSNWTAEWLLRKYVSVSSKASVTCNESGRPKKLWHAADNAAESVRRERRVKLIPSRASHSPRLLTFIGRINDEFGAGNEHEEKEQKG